MEIPCYHVFGMFYNSCDGSYEPGFLDSFISQDLAKEFIKKEQGNHFNEKKIYIGSRCDPFDEEEIKYIIEPSYVRSHLL